MIEDIKKDPQERIRDLLRKNPGINMSKIAELLNMRIIEVERHLSELEKNKIISSVQDVGYRRFYLGSPGFEVSEESVQETRDRIYNLIAQNPGLHLSKIAELLKMSKPLAEYHLQRMEKEEKITVLKETGYKRYYIYCEEIEPQDKKIFSLLRKDIPLKIVLFLANHKNAKHKEILKYLNIAPSTLSYHLNSLIKQGIVTIQRYGDEKGYALKNEKELLAFVLKYRLHIVVDGFKELWDGLNYKRW
jgi:predicted transcriptional regulator